MLSNNTDHIINLLTQSAYVDVDGMDYSVNIPYYFTPKVHRQLKWQSMI